MQRNIGTPDRLFRFIIFFIFLSVSLYFKNALLFFCALFVLYEVVAGWCAFYALLGKSTCSIQKNPRYSLPSWYVRGFVILIGAILLNSMASYIGISTWYEVFMGTASWNIYSVLFLFLVYPLSLGILANPRGW